MIMMTKNTTAGTAIVNCSNKSCKLPSPRISTISKMRRQRKLNLRDEVKRKVTLHPTKATLYMAVTYKAKEDLARATSLSQKILIQRQSNSTQESASYRFLTNFLTD